MRARNVLTGALLGAGSVIGGVLFRRRAARLRERVDLYFGDGTMVSLTGASAAEPFVRHAREMLTTARG
ncbi:MAG: hypothetical protein M3R70_01455 [Actinomycetota bacterium]|nr:hypothetical protein [Actinomycetota bacterium]